MQKSVDESGRVIRGTVRDQHGAAVAEATVTVIDAAGTQIAITQANSSGAFSAHGVPDGQYVLVTSADDHDPVAVTLLVTADTAEVPVVLNARVGLVGTVLSTDNADPVAGALVTVTDSSGAVVASATADAAGAWQVPGLPDGTYTFVASAPGHQVTATSTTVDAGARRPIDLRLSTAVTLTGAVSDGTGRGVGHSHVALLDSAGTMTASAFTDDAGRFVFTDLVAGDYTVLANGYPPVAATVDVQPGRFAGHDFVLGEEVR